MPIHGTRLFFPDACACFPICEFQANRTRHPVELWRHESVETQTVLRSAARGFSTSVSALAAQCPPDDVMLHRSRIPTMHFQDSLLALPIPELNATLEKYVLVAST